MISTPTDRLHKLAAIGGLALAVGAGGGALHQYHETALQNIEAYEKVLRGVDAYNRFAELAREQIGKAERLKDPSLSAPERAKIQNESSTFRERIEPLDKEVQEALVQMQKQVAITEHYYRMQAIWLFIAAASFVVGTYLSWRGFKA